MVGVVVRTSLKPALLATSSASFQLVVGERLRTEEMVPLSLTEKLRIPALASASSTAKRCHEPAPERELLTAKFEPAAATTGMPAPAVVAGSITSQAYTVPAFAVADMAKTAIIAKRVRRSIEVVLVIEVSLN